jgi:uncharacterized protein YjbI with pentapeptide repeats
VEHPRTALTDEEQRLLQEGTNARLVALAGRLIDGLVVADVTFEQSSLRDTELADMRFERCTFSEVDFTDTEISGTQFRDCLLKNCRFVRSHFADSSLLSCKLIGGRCKETSIQRCTLRTTHFEDILLENGSIARVRMEGGSMQRIHFSECQLSDFTVQQAQLSHVRMTLCSGASVLFDQSEASELNFLGGSFSGLRFAGGTLTEVIFVEVSAQQLCVDGAQQILGFHFKQGVAGRLSIERCPEVSGVYFWKSKIDVLELCEGTFDGWVTDCQLAPGSRVEQAVLTGFFWDESVATDLILRDVQFYEALSARSAHFKNLRLEAVFYEPGLTLFLDGASFEDGDRLGVGA